MTAFSNAPFLNGKAYRFHSTSTSEDVVNVPGFLADCSQRVKLPSVGTLGLAVCGSQVHVAEYFTDSIAAVSLACDGEAIVRSLPLGPQPQWDEARRGEVLFHDVRTCFRGWQSCASCHPEGAADALNWDLLNDGEGNPKNTKGLLWSHRTPPAMVSGVHPAHSHVGASGSRRCGDRCLLDVAEAPAQSAACAGTA